MKQTIIPSSKALKTKWYLIDAENQCLGRLATEVVKVLKGKDKVTYTPSQSPGVSIIIINADKVTVSGNKQTEKIYMRHSGRPGGKTIETFQQLQTRIPERILERAIKGMLPKNRLGRDLFTNLKIYAKAEHPHAGQNPELITF